MQLKQAWNDLCNRLEIDRQQISQMAYICSDMYVHMNVNTGLYNLWEIDSWNTVSPFLPAPQGLNSWNQL